MLTKAIIIATTLGLAPFTIASNMTVTARVGPQTQDGFCTGDAVDEFGGGDDSDLCVDFSGPAGCAAVDGYSGNLADCSAFFYKEAGCHGRTIGALGGPAGATLALDGAVSGEVTCS